MLKYSWSSIVITALGCVGCQFPDYHVVDADAGMGMAGSSGGADQNTEGGSGGHIAFGGQANSGGTAGAVGTAGAAGAPSGSGGTAGAPPVNCPTGPVVVDLLSDQSDPFYSADLGRSGTWKLVRDNTSPAPDYSGTYVAPGCSDGWSLGLSGAGGFKDWGIGWELEFPGGEDLSMYDGFRFAAKDNLATEPSVVGLVIQHVGGQSGQSYVGPVTDQWSTLEVDFEGFKVDGMASNAKPIIHIDFRPRSPDQSYDFQIDNIVLFP